MKAFDFLGHVQDSFFSSLLSKIHKRTLKKFKEKYSFVKFKANTPYIYVCPSDSYKELFMESLENFNDGVFTLNKEKLFEEWCELYTDEIFEITPKFVNKCYDLMEEK